MKAHDSLPPFRAGSRSERRHDGRIAVAQSNLRWCSDGLEIACDDGEKIRFAFALDCCDREMLGYVAATEGVKGEDVRDLMVVAVEQRFGSVNRLPMSIDRSIEWLSDDGCCTIAKDTRSVSAEIGFLPIATPGETPRSNGMAEAFARTFKRDDVEVNPTPDAQTVIRPLPVWFDHDNELRLHHALG